MAGVAGAVSTGGGGTTGSAGVVAGVSPDHPLVPTLLVALTRAS